MRWHIDTIPVRDALNAGGGCLLCRLRESAQRTLVARALGGSVMSPDSRETVNRRGFCAAHHLMLYEEPQGNRLGHALMTLSHLQELRPKVSEALREGKSAAAGSGRGFLPRGRNGRGEKEPPHHRLQSLAMGCALCDDLRHQEEIHLHSLLHLWGADGTLRDAFRASGGLCVPHTAAVFHSAPRALSGDLLATLLDAAGGLLEANLRTLEGDLDHFTRKFDYRNAGVPWNGAKDALERAMSALRGLGFEDAASE